MEELECARNLVMVRELFQWVLLMVLLLLLSFPPLYRNKIEFSSSGY